MVADVQATVEPLADGARKPGHAPDQAIAVDVDDILVFEWASDRFRLTGGRGRGSGWANIVEVGLADNPTVERAWKSGVPVRVSARHPVRVAGPYWASHAVVVPVGQDHLVVFGGARRISTSDAAIFGAAARAVSETGAVSAEKLLADELEVVHAVSALTSYQARNVRDTARHIATVAARALACEVAAVQVRGADHSTLEVMRVSSGDGVDADPRHAGRDAARFLEAAAAMTDPMVEQTVGPDPQVWAAQVVSRMTLPIRANDGLGALSLGALSLGHESGHERGFTMLCQRIGRALAESAEPLLSQAIAHERLAVEHELLRKASETDPLTGIGNRTAWDAATASMTPPTGDRKHMVLSVDVDDLKLVNDQFGHAAGDMLIRAAANVLRSTLRSNDVVARVGGDEFLALLRNSGEREARLVIGRIYRQMRSWRVTEHGLTPYVSAGWAAFETDWPSTISAADARMYAVKRQRRRSASRRQPVPPDPETRTRSRRADTSNNF